MIDMNATYYGSQPTRLNIGKSYIIFRWNIKQLDESQWSAYEIRVDSPVTINKVIEMVFTNYYGNDHENKLINEYNSAKLGIITGIEAEDAIKSYTDFLTERAELKSDIETMVGYAIKLNQI